MPQLIDLTGKTFGRLTVLRRVPPKYCPTTSAFWLCRCVCGNHTMVKSDGLLSARTTSCACAQRDAATTHGQARHGHESGAYVSYRSAKLRCEYPGAINYRNYGGRGIQFRFNSFDQFFTELGPRPKGESVDRINTEGHYEPGNVKWSTRSEQARNKRPQAKKVGK